MTTLDADAAYNDDAAAAAADVDVSAELMVLMLMYAKQTNHYR